MTNTKLKRTKFYIKRAKPAFLFKIDIKEKFYLLICVFSLISVNSNSFLCVLPLVIIQLCSDRTTMYICAAAATVFYISTIAHTAFYVPCVAFVLVYLMGEYMLQQSAVKPIWFAASVFALCKIYVLTFGYQPIYHVVFALETAALLLLPSIAATGFKLIKALKENLSAAQMLDAAAALLISAAAVTGLNIYGFNVSVWLLFSAAMYFELKDSVPLSLTAFMCMTVMVCQDKNFSFLFAGFMAIYLGSSALLKQGSKGYISTALLSAIISMLFITKFNSFVFVSITAAALAAAFAADKFVPVVYTEKNTETSGENDYIQLTHQLDRLNRCFSFLGHTVIDISNLISKEEIPQDISDAVAQKYCRNCKDNTVCWQENYSYTQNQFSGYAYSLQKGRKAEFDGLFLSRCSKAHQLYRAFEQLYQLENTKQLIARSGKHNQKILQNQFLTIAQILQDITYTARRSGAVNAAYTHLLNSFIGAMSKHTEYCLCCQNNSRCVIGTKDVFSGAELNRIRLKLENMYGEKFAEAVKTDAGQETVYTFYAVPKYSAEFGTYSKSRHTVCGDICEFFKTEEKNFVIMADGMGTGSFAAAESRTAVTMLKSLLTSGVKVPTALEITNTALNLKGTGQSCVALDILEADCYSGSCSLYKAGGAASIVLDRGRIKKLYKDSLPIGILKDTKIEQIDFSISNGDSVLMLSDGVQITEEMLCKTQLMAERLTAEETARLIAEEASATDDATAAVFRFVRT